MAAKGALTILVLITCACGGGYKPSPEATGSVSDVNTISLTSYGAAGHGGDDTAVLQKAIKDSALNGKALIVPAGVTAYHVRPLQIPSKAHIILARGVVIQAAPGYTTYQRMINIVDSQDVEITGNGATIRMDPSDYTNGEYRHCIYIAGAQNVHLRGLHCDKAAGDGLYVAGSDNKPFSEAIYLDNVTADGNRRQGLTVISAKDMWIRHSTFTHSHGVSPQSGIDIEPERATDHIENVHIEDSETASNAGDGIRIAFDKLNSRSSPVSLFILRHLDRKPGRNGLYGSSENRGSGSVDGTVSINQFSSEDAALYGMVFSFWSSSGPKVTVRSASVLNANRSRSTDDNTAIAVIRGGGGIGPLGNVSFIGTSIRDTNKEPLIDHYFTFTDYSHVGIQNVEFTAPGVLTGARIRKSLGIFQGSEVNTFTATDTAQASTFLRLAEQPAQSTHGTN
jgi:hypothetical protein